MKRTYLAPLALVSAAVASAAAQAPRVPQPPAVFLANHGQWPAETAFVLRSPRLVAHLRERTVWMELPGAAAGVGTVGLVFEGTGGPRLQAETVVPGRYHFLLDDRVHPDVRGYESVVYRGVQPGVDVRLRTEAGRLVYDHLVAPGVDPSSIAVRCLGVQSITIESDGSLALRTRGGVLRHSRPVAWDEDATGGRQPVACSFRLLGEWRYGFAAPDHDPARRLVIDPGVEWATFLGDSGTDYATTTAVAPNGEIVVAGFTSSSRFPTTAGAHDTSYGSSSDAFVTRMSPDGKTLVWSTFLGGNGGRDWATAIHLAGTGEVTVGGYTESSTFPTTTGAWQTTYGGTGDGFVARLKSDGSGLLFSTYVGAGDYDLVSGVAVGASGDIAVIGWTESTKFPTTAGAYDTVYAAAGDGFVVKLNPSASTPHFSTYLGGTVWDTLAAVALDAQGAVTVAGETWGMSVTSDFPTTPGAWDRTYGGGKSDGVVARLASDGKTLLWSTLLGGNSWDPILDLHLAADGTVTVCGDTWSSDWPTTAGVYQPGYAGNGDAHLTRLSADGSRVLLATYLGGKLEEEMPYRVGQDPFGAWVLTGWSKASDFPLTAGATQKNYGGAGDAFVSRLSPDLKALWHSTYLGGTGFDSIRGQALVGASTLALAGETYHGSFPVTAGAYDTSYGGGGDAFVCRYDLLPVGTARFGTPTPACLGPIHAGLTVQPRAPEPAFALLYASAPPNTAGLVLIGAAPFPTGLPILGFKLYLDPFQPLLFLSLVSSPTGSAQMPLPLAAGLKGVRVFVQSAWLNTAACGGLGTWSASDALDLTVQ